MSGAGGRDTDRMMKRAAPGTDADEDSCEGHRRAELANRWSKKMKMDDGGGGDGLGK